MKLLLVLACMLAGCAGSADTGGDDGDTCSVSLSAFPAVPIVGSEVRVTASVTSNGIATYYWSVRKAGVDVPFEDANAQGSEIRFTASQLGTYTVKLSVSAPTAACPDDLIEINVNDAANVLDVRLHVTPPPGLDQPPTDKALLIPGGATYALGTVTLDAPRVTSGTVTSAGGGIPAYLTFLPDGEPEAVVEMYADGAGAFSGHVLNRSHSVLVVPSDPALPPHRFTPGTPMEGEAFTITAGAAITGVVRAPNNAGLANAKVQLAIDGVPSTIGTTAADGTFTVRAQNASGVETTIIVTPPASSGLPRLEATAAFSPAATITVAYAATLATRDVMGVQVQRAGALPNAKVTFVGTLPAAATITAGATASALGYVRVAVTANASGALPSARVPAAPLKAVVSASAGDFAVADFSTVSSVPTTISASSMILRQVTVGHAGPLPGARLELVPVGALALAGVPSSFAIANASGVISAAFAQGGVYTAVFSDPTLHAGGTRIADTATLPVSLELPPALVVSGTLIITGLSNPVAGAAVELRCTQCTGIDRLRPLAEAVSSEQGTFSLAITDPSAL